MAKYQENIKCVAAAFIITIIFFNMADKTFANSNESEKIPKDVVEFQERRDLCDHFRGEPPYDEKRRKFLIIKMKETCTGADTELKALKKKYKNDAEVMKILRTYEENIETE
ncbi:MAG: hypothetical protein ABH872_07145 [Candidatus Omnitrophota bacterium]